MRGFLVDNGVVTNIALFEELPDGWITAPDGVSIGWTYNNQDKTFLPPPEQPKTTAQILSDCQCSLANKRSLEARSGVVVNGVEMQTDKESIAAMDQYATESMMNGLDIVHWEKADGTFHDWPIADFKKLFSEITKYVNNCFGRQSQLLDEVNAAPDPTTVDISTGWPSKTITFV